MTRADWLTIQQAMNLTGRSRRTIYRWRSEDRLATIRPRRIVYYSRTSLLAADAATRPQFAVKKKQH